MADIDYFEDESQWGGYQYVTLEQIVTDYMMSMNADDFSSTVPRFKVVYQAKKGLKQFYYDVLHEIRAVELDLSPNLTVTVPPDLVNFVRISWVDDKGMLHPMAVDTRMSLAAAYLQDNNYELIYDDNGCVLIGSGRRDRVGEPLPNSAGSHCYQFSGYVPNVNRSTVYPNGKYRYDKARGVIEFSSSVSGKSIVIEYISDGLFTGNCESMSEEEIRVHKFAEEGLLNYITYELIKNRRNVPMNEKMRARKEYYNSLRIAKRRINTLRKNDLMQVFKGSTRMIEG